MKQNGRFSIRFSGEEENFYVIAIILTNCQLPSEKELHIFYKR